jgi:hypothetical protein
VSSKRITLEVPELSVLDLEKMSFQTWSMERECFSAVELMRRLASHIVTLDAPLDWLPGSMARVGLQRVFLDLARLLEAVRLSASQVEDYEGLTDGEIAIVKGNKAIASKLGDVIDLLKEDLESRKTVAPL